MQRITITGNLGGDAVGKARPTGKKERYLQFQVAVTHKWTDKETGVKQEDTTWYTCFWDKMDMGQYLTKGTKVLIEGRPVANAWIDKDGTVCSAISIRVNLLELMGGKPREAGTTTAQVQTKEGLPKTDSPDLSGFASEVDDDLPF